MTEKTKTPRKARPETLIGNAIVAITALGPVDFAEFKRRIATDAKFDEEAIAKATRAYKRLGEHSARVRLAVGMNGSEGE